MNPDVNLSRWEDSANRMRDKAPKGWWTGYILRVTTHRWFNRTVTNRIQWWHWMTVIAPDDMHNAHKGLVLFVIGSGWSQFHYHHVPDKDEMFTAAFAPLVVELGILGAVLHQQPMEPISFYVGPHGPGSFKDLEEDELMASHAHPMPIPCPSHAHPMPIPCPSHAHPMPIPCPSHAHPMPIPCPSHAHPMPTPCPSHAHPMPILCPSPASIPVSFAMALEHPDELEWQLSVPMAKSIVRGMDALQLASRDIFPHLPVSAAALVAASVAVAATFSPVEGFVLMGVSKRALMAWVTAALDKRVVGMVAYGFDLLDFGRNVQHLHDSLGAWPVILKFYATFNVTSQLQSPQFQRLTEDTDPYYFKERLTMPKLLVSAANDEVHLVERHAEPKLLKIMANSEHVNQWANQATLSFLASLLHVNSSCASLPASSRPSLTWTRPSNAPPSPRRRKRFDKTEGTGLFAREERETAERETVEAQTGGTQGGGVVGTEGDALTNQEQPPHPWSCVPELPAVDWPRLRWRFDWSTFTIHATSDRKPLAVRAWTARTASARRDFRFVVQRGSKGWSRHSSSVAPARLAPFILPPPPSQHNTPPPLSTAPVPTVPGTYAGKFDLCVQATPFFLHTVSPPKHHPEDGLWHFSSTVSDVPK
ncbi:unnamed protein product, partial [Closterium sp. Naga37s-1]